MRQLTSLITCLVMFIACMNVWADDKTTALPDNGKMMFADDALFVSPLHGSAIENAKKRTVAIKDMPFEKALEVEILVKPQFDREIQINIPTTMAIEDGDALFLELWARTLSSDDEQNQVGEIRLVLEQNFKPWKKIIWMKQEVGKGWTHYQVPVDAKMPLEAGTAKVALRIGGRKQVLQIGGLRLLNFKQSISAKKLPHSDLDYMGMSENAPWRAEAAKRIEQYRKADMKVELVDLLGQPISDAKVHVQMTRHAFGFGCVYNTRWFHGSHSETEDGKKYRQMYKKLFNIGVDEGAMKWSAWENPKAWPGVEASLSWMEENDIDVRGHCLVWGSFLRMPKDLSLIIDNTDVLKQRVINHIHDAVGATRGRVIAWDVVNEPQSHTDIFKNLDDEVMVDWFKAAHQANPQIGLALNETTTGSMDGGMDTFERHARMLLAKGAPITSLGFQSHFSQLGMPIDQVYAILERFGKLGLDLEITEFDYSGVDEKMQAAFTRDYMTICFSHPKVISFLHWGFWAGSHWRPDRALFNKDWSIKPNGQTYMDLVFDKWWTDVKTKTDGNGKLQVRGFQGDYLLTIEAQGKTMTRQLQLPREGCTLKVVVP